MYYCINEKMYKWIGERMFECSNVWMCEWTNA